MPRDMIAEPVVEAPIEAPVAVEPYRKVLVEGWDDVFADIEPRTPAAQRFARPQPCTRFCAWRSKTLPPSLMTSATRSISGRGTDRPASRAPRTGAPYASPAACSSGPSAHPSSTG